jgi:2-phospho-L-lactate/phosphoenolpyruvate guanylyltransferase
MNEEPTSIWAVLPVKRFEAAKSRLAPVLSEAERATLARGMFERLLGLLVSTSAFSGVLVVTDSREVSKLAVQRGAAALPDPAGARTLADVVDAALEEVERRGASSALVLVCDLPTATNDDIARLVDELGRRDVVLSHDARGAHTNALGLRLSRRFRTRFGSETSADEHCEAAERAALSIGFVETPTLAFDVDTPEDYALLLSRG